jgi:hypothetical protein
VYYPAEDPMALRSRGLVAILATLAHAVHAGDAAASPAESLTGWQPDGLPIIARDGQQLPISIHPDGSGGAFIFWRDDLPPDPRTSIYASHITGAGTFALGWPVTGNPIFAGSSGLTVVPDRSGGFYMVWIDDARGQHLIAQRMARDGTLRWAPEGVEVCHRWTSGGSDHG